MPQPTQRTTTVTDARYMLKLHTYIKFKPFKLAGTDVIVSALLQQEVSLLMSRLCHVFRACLVKDYIPKAWRQVKVTFSLKQRNAN